MIILSLFLYKLGKVMYCSFVCVLTLTNMWQASQCRASRHHRLLASTLIKPDVSTCNVISLKQPNRRSSKPQNEATYIAAEATSCKTKSVYGQQFFLKCQHYNKSPQNTLESISTKSVHEVLCRDRSSISSTGIRNLVTPSGNQ